MSKYDQILGSDSEPVMSIMVADQGHHLAIDTATWQDPREFRY